MLIATLIKVLPFVFLILTGAVFYFQLGGKKTKNGRMFADAAMAGTEHFAREWNKK